MPSQIIILIAVVAVMFSVTYLIKPRASAGNAEKDWTRSAFTP